MSDSSEDEALFGASSDDEKKIRKEPQIKIDSKQKPETTQAKKEKPGLSSSSSDSDSDSDSSVDGKAKAKAEPILVREKKTEEGKEKESKQEVTTTKTATKEEKKENDRLFGSDSDSSSSSDSESEFNGTSANAEIAENSATKKIEKDENSEDDDSVKAANEAVMLSDDEDRLDEPMEPKDLVVPCLPKPDIHSDIRYVKVPNFLHICPYAFNEHQYSENHEKKEMEEAGKGLLDSVIRWRYKQDAIKNKVLDENGNPILESNAKFVEWSDGSVQLLIGEQIFDVKTEKVDSQFLYTASKDSNSGTSCLESHGLVSSQVMFRPTDLKSSAHKDLALKVKERTLKGFKIKETESIKDPEALQEQRAKAKEERLRMQQRQRAKSTRNVYGRRDTWDAAYMEEGARKSYYDDDDEEEFGMSVKDIKQKYRKSRESRGSGVFSSDDDDSDESEDFSARRSSLRKRKIEQSKDGSDEDDIEENKAKKVKDADTSSGDAPAPPPPAPSKQEPEDDDDDDIQPAKKRNPAVIDSDEDSE
eukprot:CAMPEP_0204844124 /NCGR_PEP_ID=MMETSP1346-20131115/48380_1 /ASSEMBLY_ACC=CAM_ASM_000771 /TAXON_ID=215587 /ORGANISM="Aplanochytrium stocchinoi, Strain GSBS06" /LENGTH=531 /DNA_ID=CAMNT_0051983385 /DNA_START=143 /DNA_END=1739 /DNA_ORIENTATION=-